MIRMVSTKKQSVAFCKYVIAGLLWTAVFFRSIAFVYAVFVIMLISALTGVHRAPLVKLFDLTFAKYMKTSEIYINMYSMRFAHVFGCVFCVLISLSYYFLPHIVSFILTVILALLQLIAACGYCSAQKLYECVVCNSNCCRLGKKIRRNNTNLQ